MYTWQQEDVLQYRSCWQALLLSFAVYSCRVTIILSNYFYQ
ncbi:MAG: hypothetical protein ACQEQO_04830 [Thermodesulfobacteriota bacterium]